MEGYIFLIGVLLGWIASVVYDACTNDDNEINTPSPTLETPKNAGGNEGEGVGER